MELSVSGNKKIASIDQLKPLAELKTLLKIELEGCDIADDEDYRKSAFATIATLSNVDGFDKRGIEIPGKFIRFNFCRQIDQKLVE